MKFSTTTLIATCIASIAIAAPVPEAISSEPSALPAASSSSSAPIIEASGFSNSTADDLAPVEKASKLGTASTVLGVLSGAAKGYDWFSDKLGWN
ncbi:unnamed protein product [Ambrosiozyma monospora]|uniref:Unnamed protein product n=1 Tax=Ambrosiozyma monospora TaxID=43982 RepID=A0ACB5SZI6_AMBMO|nr:unnamed protein product [Ambrosiozyma monospora]